MSAYKKGELPGKKSAPYTKRAKGDKRKTREQTAEERKKRAEAVEHARNVRTKHEHKRNTFRKELIKQGSADGDWNRVKREALKFGHLSERELEYAKKWTKNPDNRNGLGRNHQKRRLHTDNPTTKPTTLERYVKDFVPDEDLPDVGPPPAPPAKRENTVDEATLEKIELLIEAANYKNSHKREFAPPFYDWQHELFQAKERQILLMAGNRTGKTFTAGYYYGVHTTQQYPPWWTGRRLTKPIVGLVAGVDNSQLRRVVQKELFGEVVDRQFGGGWIHRDEIKEVVWNPVVPGLAMEVKVQGRFGVSNISLRAYTQTRTGSKTLGFAGTSLDLVWVDECPPDELVGQLTVRTATGRGGEGGLLLYTMTPELGVTELINTFTNSPGPDQRLIGPVAWDRCPHLTPEVIASVLDGIPEHEKDMRRKGIPFFGSGLVYPVSESRVMIEPFPIPDHFRGLKAMDLGTRHPTAIAWLAYDTELDTVYLVRDYAQKNQPAAVHAGALNGLWPDIPVVFPPDVDTTEKGSGKTVRMYYEDAGIRRTLDFKNPDGTRSVEPGILELQERMMDGRFRVFSNCQQFVKERRLYHRDEKGRLVKQNDDLLDAVRYGVMMLRYAVPLGIGFRRKPKVNKAMGSRRRARQRGFRR